MRRIVVISALLGLAACGGDAGDDTAGAEFAAEWRLEFLHEIGSIDDTEQTLTRIGDVTLGPEGRLYIGQPNDAYVRVHTADGSLERLIGRRGEGPGEFGGLSMISVDEDGLWVSDSGNERMNRFTLEGTFVEDERWPSVSVSDEPAVYIYNSGGRRGADGRALVEPSSLVRAVRRGEGGGPPARPGPMPIRWLGPDGELGDSVVAIDRSLGSEVELGWYPGLTSSTLIEVLRDASGVVWVVRDPPLTSDEGFLVSRVDANGDTLFARRYAYEPLPTSRAEIVAEVEARLSEAARERIAGQIWVPDTYPPVSSVTVTSDGLVWIGREERQDPRVWWILDGQTGDHMGTLQLPEGEEVLDALGDVLVTERTDEFDVPYVRRYRIVR